jgi:hypothetical protein
MAFQAKLAATIAEGLADPLSFVVPSRRKPAADRVFLSYSHRDSSFLSRLLVHLRPLEKQGRIDAWTDRRIEAGSRWQEEIKAALANSKVAVLMISADFLASDFIVDNELPPILKTAEEQGTRIIPVIVRPCRFERDPRLGVFQAINDPRRPLSILSESEQEEIYDKLAQAVESQIDSR